MKGLTELIEKNPSIGEAAASNQPLDKENAYKLGDYLVNDDDFIDSFVDYANSDDTAPSCFS